MEADFQRDFSHLQDVMGTLPMVKRYIVLCLFFAIDAATETHSVVKSLEESLGSLAQAFPFLTGQVIYEGRDASKKMTGVPKIVPRAPTIELIVKGGEEAEALPTLSELAAARYPMSMLDPVLLMPSIATTYASDPHEIPGPVLMLQANFISGGLILTFCGNHTQMDMTGMGIVISFFAKACRAEPFTELEITQGNQPRGSAVPLLDDTYEPGAELDDVTPCSPPSDAPSPFACQPCWRYFDLSASSLARLKAEAGKQKIVPYISTDDAIAALFWQRISAVRYQLSNLDEPSTFVRPISVRKHLKLGDNYIGHMVDCISTTVPSTHTQSLGTLAGYIREDLLDEQRIIYHARAFATQLSRLSDKTELLNGAKSKPLQDLVLSSYANIRSCEQKYGDLLGYPVAARRPRMPAWPGLAYCMPKDRNGTIAVALCIAEEEIRALQKDETFRGFADYVG